MQTIVIGHRNPDMDAIVSAIGYAALKQLEGDSSAVAARCGNTNERINYVLEKFGFEAPVFYNDVRPRIADVMAPDVISARKGSPVYESMMRIGEKRFRGLPVIDEENRCIGLISGFKISQYLFPPEDRISEARQVKASIENICKTIKGTILTGDLCQKDVTHTLVVAAMYTLSFEARIKDLDVSSVVLFVGDRFNIQHASIKAGVKVMVVTGGLSVGDDVLQAAKEAGTTIISAPHDTATTVLLARSAVTAEHLLYEDFESLEADTPVDEAKSRVAMSSQFAFPVLDDESRLCGILSKSDFLKPVPRQLVLVDHNELSQAVPGAHDLPIVEILDHHRIGAVATDSPILFLNRPVGSTSTIVADCFRLAGIPVPKDVAGLLMAGVISDTLNLTSPTTTAVDHDVMAHLSNVSGIAPSALAEEIFSIGSPLLTMSPAQAVTADCKEYADRGHRFSLAQIEELTFAHFPDKRGGLIDALESYRAEKGLLFSALLVTDINTQNSLLLVRGNEVFTRSINYPQIETHIWRMDGVVSRKKQLLPYITNLLSNLIPV